MQPTLSPRETEILALVADGLTSKAIAARLGISESTVNWHLANALRKLGASSRAAAVATALRDGPLGTMGQHPQASSAREVRRWQVFLTAVMTVLLATPLVTAAALLAVRGTTGEPPRTEEPTRPPAASSAPSALASSTTIPVPSAVPSAAPSAPATTPPSPNAPSPRSAPVVPSPATSSASAIPLPLTGPALATPAIPLPLTGPALATPTIPPPLSSPPLETPAPPVPIPTLVPLVPTLPSVP